MGSALTALVTDEAAGTPAAGLRLQLYWVEPHADVLLKAASTNAHGTTPAALLSGAKLSAGVYRLVLHVGDYFLTTRPDQPRCFDVLPVVFLVEDASASRQVRISLRPDGYAVTCI